LDVVWHNSLYRIWPNAIDFSQLDPLEVSGTKASTPEDMAAFDEISVNCFWVSFVSILQKFNSIH
jgi:hypothetical protein